MAYSLLSGAAVKHQIVMRSIADPSARKQHKEDVEREAKDPELLAAFVKEYQRYQAKSKENIEILKAADERETGTHAAGVKDSSGSWIKAGNISSYSALNTQGDIEAGDVAEEAKLSANDGDITAKTVAGKIISEKGNINVDAVLPGATLIAKNGTVTSKNPIPKGTIVIAQNVPGSGNSLAR